MENVNEESTAEEDTEDTAETLHIQVESDDSIVVMYYDDFGSYSGCTK